MLAAPLLDLAIPEPQVLAVARAVFRRLVPRLVEVTLAKVRTVVASGGRLRAIAPPLDIPSISTPTSTAPDSAPAHTPKEDVR